MMKRLSAIGLAMLLSASGLVMGAAAEAPSANAPAAVESAAQAEKSQVKQLRGKLLYKRNQIRKLERAADAASEELKNQVAALETQRENLYVAAEPKLSDLYAAEKELQAQINELTPKK